MLDFISHYVAWLLWIFSHLAWYAAHAIDASLSKAAPIMVIMFYFTAFFKSRVCEIRANAKKEKIAYETQFNGVEGLAEIYKRNLSGVRKPNCFDYVKMALLTYYDIFTRATIKHGRCLLEGFAMICAFPFLIVIIDVVIRAGS